MINIIDKNNKVNKEKIVVGFDLGYKFSLLSYYSNSMDEPGTISAVTGTEMFNIPTVLAKRPSVGQWFYGREALKYAKTSGGILVDDLLRKAERGEEVIVENEAYDPIALLTLYIKRSLGMLTMHLPSKQIDGFMFTVEELSPRLVEVLGKVVAALQINCPHITYQSHVESFYSFMLHQPKELWTYQVLILEYNDILKSYRMESTKNTTPEVVFIHDAVHDNIKKIDFSADDEKKKSQFRELDDRFSEEARQILLEGDISTVYLLGDGFKESWADESLRVICKNRRVFQGNNLYSKGACYAMLDKLEPSELSKSHVYLGAEKIKANIGIKAIRRGVDSYYAILDAGNSWYEANADFDIILETGNEISFVITSLTGGHVVERKMLLEGLPKRPRGTTRLNIKIQMKSVDAFDVEIKDLGFGEIIKTTNKVWTETISI